MECNHDAGSHAPPPQGMHHETAATEGAGGDGPIGRVGIEMRSRFEGR